MTHSLGPLESGLLSRDNPATQSRCPQSERTAIGTAKTAWIPIGRVAYRKALPEPCSNGQPTPRLDWERGPRPCLLKLLPVKHAVCHVVFFHCTSFKMGCGAFLASLVLRHNQISPLSQNIQAFKLKHNRICRGLYLHMCSFASSRRLRSLSSGGLTSPVKVTASITINCMYMQKVEHGLCFPGS